MLCAAEILKSATVFSETFQGVGKIMTIVFIGRGCLSEAVLWWRICLEKYAGCRWTIATSNSWGPYAVAADAPSAVIMRRTLDGFGRSATTATTAVFVNVQRGEQPESSCTLTEQCKLNTRFAYRLLIAAPSCHHVFVELPSYKWAITDSSTWYVYKPFLCTYYFLPQYSKGTVRSYVRVDDK